MQLEFDDPKVTDMITLVVAMFYGDKDKALKYLAACTIVEREYNRNISAGFIYSPDVPKTEKPKNT